MPITAPSQTAPWPGHFFRWVLRNLVLRVHTPPSQMVPYIYSFIGLHIATPSQKVPSLDSEFLIYLLDCLSLLLLRWCNHLENPFHWWVLVYWLHRSVSDGAVTCTTILFSGLPITTLSQMVWSLEQWFPTVSSYLSIGLWITAPSQTVG